MLNSQVMRQPDKVYLSISVGFSNLSLCLLISFLSAYDMLVTDVFDSIINFHSPLEFELKVRWELSEKK